MQTYTVIWRDQSDEYMFTEVQTNDEPDDVPAVGWVMRAAEVEYAEWESAVERVTAIAELIQHGFELINVVKGKLESVL